MTVPEGNGVGDWTPRDASEVPPVGDTEAGFRDPELKVFGGSITIATPVKGWRMAGTWTELLPTSGVTRA